MIQAMQYELGRSGVTTRADRREDSRSQRIVRMTCGSEDLDARAVIGPARLEDVRPSGVVGPQMWSGGRYCENCHVAERLEGDTFSAVSEGVRPYALDPEHTKALWARSEKMVRETF
jgi:hypothetical protein